MTTPAQRQRFRQDGRCVNCGGERDREGSRCTRCLRPRQARYARLKAQGQCVGCRGIPEVGYVYCAACCAKATAKRQG